MKYRKLNTTNIDVSVLCLGTMTFGEQNTQSEGFEQMDYAIDNGINFFDTADIYGLGRSEEILGKALGNQREYYRHRRNWRGILSSTSNIIR